MNILQLIVVVMVLYLGGMLAVGFYGKKYANSFEDYLTAAKQGTFLMVCGSYIGSHIGNGIVVGGAEYGAIYGIGGIWYGVGSALGYVLFAFVLSKRLYRSEQLTMSDILNHRYGARITGTIFAVFNALAAMSIMAGQIIAGKNLFSYFGMNATLGAAAVCIIVFIYSTMSGQWGVLMTDMIQVAVIFFCTVIVFGCMLSQGGLGLMRVVLPSSFYELIPFEIDTWVMMLFPSMLYGLISSASFQRNMSCKDEKTAFHSAFWGAMILLPYVVLPVMIGMYGIALYPDAAPGTILFHVLIEAFPPLVAALMIAALMAAVMSTVDSQLIYVTGSFTNDIYKAYFDKNASEKKLNRIAHAATFLIGIIVLYLALGAKTIISMLSAAYTFMCAGTLVMFVGGIFWKKATKAGAIASSITGMLFVILYKYCGVQLPVSSIFPILPSLIAYIIVSLMTQPKEAAKR